MVRGSLLLILILASGCSTVPEIPVAISTPPAAIHPTSISINPVTQEESKPVLYLCLSDTPKGWPVDQIQKLWNANGKNLLTSDLTKKCRDTIHFKLVTSSTYEGETEFTKDKIEVRLDKNSKFKAHTLCHELGHVLGLPHNDHSQSCMNIDKTVTHPSTVDIQKVGAQYWIKEESARHATGQ